ncbi:putative transporter [Plesiocystis pacifica SIR-1]|uniref:Putative transporter n=1 Tax=Plesiocystis pacifica SIR-1 TaxID=391625 RepID=A6FYJ6_9BACT|nr:cation:proton antiporter [Plesiocystis pacifica]EDM81268.1 putative transporter [Plesiocystis pacifica SIR-1]
MHHLVADLAIVLGVAAVVSLVFQRLGQSSVLGYLFAGLIVGPYIPIPIFADTERIAALSEFGVVLVMFAVGLEFSVRRLLKVLPVAGFAGGAQVCAMMALGWGLARVLGFELMDAVFLGACVAISSTMVVAKVFDERAPEPRVRELVFGVLVVQDLAAILLVAGLTTLASGASLDPAAIGAVLVKLVALLLVLTVAGLFVVPRLVRWVVDRGSTEALVVLSTALAFGLAHFAESLGYSVALGAFLAGTLVAESGRGHQIEALVHPVRDLFGAVFFVSVGMTVDPRVAVDYFGLAVLVSAVVIVGQFVVVSTAGILSGNGVRRSVTAGLSLGQIGEFAFIIAAIGASAGLVGPFLQPVVVTVAVITAFTTPLLARVSDRVATVVDGALPRPLQTFACLCESWFETARAKGGEPRRRSHLRSAAAVLVIDGVVVLSLWLLVAYFRGVLSGQVEAWTGAGEPWAGLLVAAAGLVVSLPLVITMLRTARRVGQLLADRVLPVRLDGELDLAAAPRRAFVVALQSMVVLAVSTPVVLFVTPFVGSSVGLLVLGVLGLGLGVVFWRSATNLQGHVRAGTAALVALVERQMTDEHDAAPIAGADALLPGLGATEAVLISAHAWACGRTLAELNLRALTGATVLAISHEGETRAMPSGQDRVDAGVTMILAGATHAVAAARELLERGPEGPPAAT